IPQLAGRDFSESDTAESTPVAIVSEAVAKEQFAADDPVGRRLRINVNHANGREDVEWTVVGVVGDTKASLDAAAGPTIYIPRTQGPSNSTRLFARTAQNPASLGTSVAWIVHSMEPEALVDAAALGEVIGRTIARPRALSVLVGVFALVALVLAAVGVYGVMA